jgi:hypothetical protein
LTPRAPSSISRSIDFSNRRIGVVVVEVLRRSGSVGVTGGTSSRAWALGGRARAVGVAVGVGHEGLRFFMTVDHDGPGEKREEGRPESFTAKQSDRLRRVLVVVDPTPGVS